MSLEHSPARNAPAPAAYTIPEFCNSHRISRAKLYQLWAAGAGPRYINIGVKRIISVEAAEAWCRQMEAAKDPQAEERTREAAKRAVSFTKRVAAKRAANQSAGEAV
jgi:hypothetical protein